MINTVILQGRLTAQPELKTTQNGTSVTSFTIANDRGYGDDKATNFIPCVAWRGTAEFISHHFIKGSAIAVEGSIQSRRFQDKNGDNRTAYEVVVSEVHFVEKKKEEAFTPATEDELKAEAEYAETNLGEDLPF